MVDFFESERGWGSDSWSNQYETEQEALDAVHACNKNNPTDHVPDHHIVATYVGPKLIKI